jgi:hypothetical protein
MTLNQLIMHEMSNLPPKYKRQILDFIGFLKLRKLKERKETALLSESALKKDWDRPEEDETWKDL